MLLESELTLVHQAAACHQQEHPMWPMKHRQQRCRPEVPTLLLQLTTLPRWMLNVFQTLAALQFLRSVSPVFRELDRQVLLLRAPAKQPLPSEPFRYHPCTKYLKPHAI